MADGDARRAITSLPGGRSEGEYEGLSTIPMRLVEDSVMAAEEEVRQKAISKLNNHQRVLYQCIKEDGPLIQKELFERYCEEHPDPITLRGLRKSHLPKLLHYNLVEAERSGDGKTYRLID